MNEKPQTALLVDDDPLDLIILEDLLQSQSNGAWHIVKANSASAALERIRENTEIDLLLMDICMPGVDGAKFLRQLAEIGFRSRIILVSSLNTTLMHSIGELGRTHGLNLMGFIQKPASAQALKELLRRRREPSATAKTAQIVLTADKPAALALSPERLAKAIAEGEILPWYQPKLESSTLRLVGVEALARWQLPGGTMINPAQFIPAIESHALADALFESMFRQVLADVARWRAAGRQFAASVNLSMDSALDLTLPERIEALARQHDVPPDQLTVEITESRLMADKSRALETLSRISLKGFTLSIDDFGTGYSSLSQLAALPFNELKIDGSFVQRATADSKAMAILKSTITFGRSLGMGLVAEGVETFEQLDLLRNLGVAQVQGYLTARPMSVQNLNDWLDNWRPGLATSPGCARPFTVLIVDDSRSMRTLIDAELSNRIPGARVLHAANGEQALAIVAEHVIDGVTLDFHMPGQNGIELLRRLRNIMPAARYILLTGELSEAVAREAVATGALYFPKPLSSLQFDRVVEHFL